MYRKQKKKLIYTCAIAHFTIGPQAMLARLTFSNV